MRDTTGLPDRVYMAAPGLTVYQARQVALDAVRLMRLTAPKLSGNSSRRLVPLYGEGHFGVRWMDSYVWFQEIGIHPFTNHNLAGKIIPMWVNDPDGKERNKNPKIKVRHTADGRTQVLIFRKAARPGQRKNIKRNGTLVSVPRAYPGAPGRIAIRNLNGQIAKGNVGVRWRHPGLKPKSFLYNGMIGAALHNGVEPTKVIVSNERWR